MGTVGASRFITTCLVIQLELSMFTVETTKCLTYLVIREIDGYMKHQMCFRIVQ